MARFSATIACLAAVVARSAAQSPLNIAASIVGGAAAKVAITTSAPAALLPTATLFTCTGATPPPQCAFVAAETTTAVTAATAFQANVLNKIIPAGQAAASLSFTGAASVMANGMISTDFTFDAAYAAVIAPIIAPGTGYNFVSASLYFISDATALGAGAVVTSANGFAGAVNGAAATTVTLAAQVATNGLMPPLGLRFDFTQDVTLQAGVTPTVSLFFTSNTAAAVSTSIVGLPAPNLALSLIPAAVLPTGTATVTDPFKSIHDALHITTG